MAALSAYNLVLNPLRPWEARLSPAPSARALAAATSLETLGRHPLFGTGPGSSPGFRGFQPFDAHLTPLNVAATLGLPGPRRPRAGHGRALARAQAADRRRDLGDAGRIGP